MEKDNSGKSKPTILTCAQPTGILTIGNYLGAVRNWSECWIKMIVILE